MAEVISETNFELPDQTGFYRGKVADNYTVAHEVGELYVSVRTDRISAFDVVLPDQIPYKGQVLNQMSAAILDRTQSIAPNWLLDVPDPNVSLGYKADPIKVEMIVRGYLLGSAWKDYIFNGMRNLCGNRLPNYMHEFEPFAVPLVTPTNKAETGHDVNITPHEIVEQGLASQMEYDQMSALAIDLFTDGQALASERGLVLADTKYEFGRLATGELVLIDEVHTPDSSRYFPAVPFNVYVKDETRERPEQLSKEFVREWLKAQGFTGAEGQVPPSMPPEIREEVSSKYQQLYSTIVGQPFKAEEVGDDVLEAIQANIEASLADLKV